MNFVPPRPQASTTHVSRTTSSTSNVDSVERSRNFLCESNRSCPSFGFLYRVGELPPSLHLLPQRTGFSTLLPTNPKPSSPRCPMTLRIQDRETHPIPRERTHTRRVIRTPVTSPSDPPPKGPSNVSGQTDSEQDCSDSETNVHRP